MKTAAFIAAVVGLASTVVSSPLQERSNQAQNGPFSQEGSLLGTRPDGSGCLVSNVEGGRDTRCSVKGLSVLQLPPESDEKPQLYSYSYDSYPDGSSMVTITLESGRTCTYDMTADVMDETMDDMMDDTEGGTTAESRGVNGIIVDAAKKCLAEEKESS